MRGSRLLLLRLGMRAGLLDLLGIGGQGIIGGTGICGGLRLRITGVLTISARGILRVVVWIGLGCRRWVGLRLLEVIVLLIGRRVGAGLRWRLTRRERGI
jgi:hypothetical protein